MQPRARPVQRILATPFVEAFLFKVANALQDTKVSQKSEGPVRVCMLSFSISPSSWHLMDSYIFSFV